MECPVKVSAPEVEQCFKLELDLKTTTKDIGKAQEHICMDHQGAVEPEYYDAIQARFTRGKSAVFGRGGDGDGEGGIDKPLSLQ